MNFSTVLKSSLIWISLVLASVSHSSANNFPPKLNFVLREVWFGGDGNHTLKNDDATQTFAAPHYKDPENQRFPTAYTKGSTPQVQMKFEVTLDETPADPIKIEIRAIGPSNGTTNMNLPVQSFMITAGGKQGFIYNWSQTAAPFPGTIKFYGPGIGTFAFHWQTNVDGAGWNNWTTTNHRIYLTAGTPACKRGNRETLFYYGCHKPDGMYGGAGTESLVTEAIYTDFSITKKMMRINSSSGDLYQPFLKFYLDPSPANPTNEILEDGTGVCGQWSRFFADVLHVHGYQAQILIPNATHMIFSDGSAHGSAGWFVKGFPESDHLVRASGGQGPGNPQCGWQAHSIALAYEKYYDPSYGIGSCDSKAHYEDQAIRSYFYEYVNIFNQKTYHKEQRTAKAPPLVRDPERLNYAAESY